MANKIEINAQNYESMKALALANRNAGVPAIALEKAISEYERNVLNNKAERNFAEFVVNEVNERQHNCLAWSGESILLINAHKANTTFGGEVLEVLNGYTVQGLRYVAVNKFDRFGQYYASATFLADDFFLKGNELWIKDIYDNNGNAKPHHYKKFCGELVDGTKVEDIRTFVNANKWQALEDKRIAKNQKLSEVASSK